MSHARALRGFGKGVEAFMSTKRGSGEKQYGDTPSPTETAVVVENTFDKTRVEQPLRFCCCVLNPRIQNR